jgi:hypothetical protein
MIKNTLNKKHYFLSIIIFLLLLLPSTSIVISNQNKIQILQLKELNRYSTYQNTPPNPPIIEGPLTGKPGKTYEYSFTLTDPDENDILTILEVDFGDEITGIVKKNCEKPWINGTVIKILQNWQGGGEYNITARVLDISGDWSEWSNPFVVKIQKSKVFQNLLINYFPFLSNIQYFF